MPDEPMDVPEFLRSLPAGAVFTHGRVNEQPDIWVKFGDRYRRTYSWVLFEAEDFRSWTHAELTEPVHYSITQAEADAMEAAVRRRRGPREMGQ
jgi:hypothetical protein